jgi:hypothetical protein
MKSLNKTFTFAELSALSDVLRSVVSAIRFDDESGVYRDDSDNFILTLSPDEYVAFRSAFNKIV